MSAKRMKQLLLKHKKLRALNTELVALVLWMDAGNEQTKPNKAHTRQLSRVWETTNSVMKNLNKFPQISCKS